ncbi:hypothetical protein BEN30_14355 [Magnetovibrio blakemorei]|uniref:Cytochrome c domain-containing protein n=1 Tax=Magnetovibrio blakemorei TaxID=28181 RepID=A0A1E5Q579_9PROT|nr:hypothetical protein BEN30_14355 [Magnetovibrio blakemorei]
MLFGIAVVVVLFMTETPAMADRSLPQELAAELLIVRSDLVRLTNEPGLPATHAEGLQQRIKGSLGLLPWLLQQAHDEAGADQLLKAQSSRRLLITVLNQLIIRHPLDTAPYATEHLTPTQRREASAIHDAYCASCHDDMGDGDEASILPSRDLFLMAKESSSEAFLARLINGVKGDETMLFTNPLTPRQISALWLYYRKR